MVEVPGRYLVHDGDLVELDLETFGQIDKVHLFLFNDWSVDVFFLQGRFFHYAKPQRQKLR